MTTILKIFNGEAVRNQLEGVSMTEMPRIMSEPIEQEYTSPFAQVLGIHLAAEPIRTQTVTKIIGGKKKHRRR